MLSPDDAIITFFFRLDLAIDKHVALTHMIEIDTKSSQEYYYLCTFDRIGEVL
jgi:hypothetical protein